MLSKDNRVELMRLVGQYLIDRAEEFYPVEYSDLTDEDVWIHLKRLRPHRESEATQS